MIGKLNIHHAWQCALSLLILISSTIAVVADSFAADSGEPLPTPPVQIVEYRFDEFLWNGTSGEVLDSSGNGHHATANNKSGSVLPTTNHINRAITGATGTCGYGVFDGTQYVDLPTTFPNLSNNMTISAWINPADINQVGQRIVADDQNNNGGYALSLSDGLNSLGKIIYLKRNNTTNLSVVSNVTLQNNNWYFVAVSTNATTNQATLYIYNQSGTLLDKVTASIGFLSFTDAGTASIANENSASTETKAFFGSIDEVRVYQGEQNQTEIEADKNRIRACPVYATNINANSYNCIAEQETNLAGNLYMQLAGRPFNIKVVARKSDGTAETAVSAATDKKVTLRFIDRNNANSLIIFNDGSNITSKEITYPAGGNTGIVHVNNLVITHAFSRLACSIEDNDQSPVQVSTSTDVFSVKPAYFLVTSTQANADSTGTNPNTPNPITTGANFNLTVTAYNINNQAISYNGGPILHPAIASTTYVQPHVGAITNGRLAGVFTRAVSGVSSGNFTYSEVGYFRLGQYAVADYSFTFNDKQVGDCINDFTNTANAEGKFGCNIGSQANSYFFGRFIPQHFALIPGSNTEACDSGNFTYFGQDGLSTSFTLAAQNASGATTQNYTGHFVKLTNAWPAYNFTATGVPATASLLASATAPVANWLNGVAAITAKHQVTRPTTLSAPTHIAVFARPVDADGVTMTSTTVSPPSEFRLGRLYLPNGYGSELLPLTATVEAQHWNGTAFVRNQLDTCTVVPSQSVAMGNYRKGLAACETQLTGTGSMINGVTELRLSAPGPGNGGSVDLSVNLNTAGGSTCNTAVATAATSASLPWMGMVNPSARATFGVYKTPVIYMRENF